MSDDNDKKPDSEQPEEPDTPQADGPENADNGKEPGPIPYERFKQVNDNYKELKSELDDLKAKEQERQEKAKKAKEKQLEEQQEFKELADKRATERDEALTQVEELQATVERQTEALTKFYEASKTAVPEMFQPLLDEMDLVKRLEWIAENEDKLKTKSPSSNGIPRTPQPKGKGELSDKEKRRRAARTF